MVEQEGLAGILGNDESYPEKMKIYPGVYVAVYSENPKDRIRKKGNGWPKLRGNVAPADVLEEGQAYRHILVPPAFQAELGILNTRTVVYAELLNFFGENGYSVEEVMIDGAYWRSTESFADEKTRSRAGQMLACSELEQLIGVLCNDWIHKEGKGVPKISPRVEGDVRYPVVNKADAIAYSLNRYYSRFKFNLESARKHKDSRTNLKPAGYYKAIIETLNQRS